MSELISGKEALIALANGEEVETCLGGEWLNSDHVKALQVERIIENYYNFRLKPRTITINGIEIPATFKPVEGDTFYYLSPEDECGYDYKCFVEGYPYFDGNKIQFGAWRTESEIKQVVAAQRIVFKPQ